MRKNSYKIVFSFLFSLSVFSIIGQKNISSNVYFGFNSFELTNTSKQHIDSSITNLKFKKIYLQGHCDSIGSNSYNDKLSINRVNEVKKYLLSKKVKEEQIVIKALGKRYSINKNENEQERALNRRVELEFILEETLSKENKEAVKEDNSNLNVRYVEFSITGVVFDENGKPVIAEVTLNDKTGTEVANTITDNKGKYLLKANVNTVDDYNLIIYDDESFISSRIVNATNKKPIGNNIKTILPKLKDGNKYTLENFNFVGDTSQLLDKSKPSLEALYKLMKKNTSLVIRIEGHVNYPTGWGNPNLKKTKSDKYVPPGMTYAKFNQWLSEERAKIVYNYLVEKGIDKNRLSIKGYGADVMLYPDATNEYEMERNRRVEINVISFKK